jgi:hypothetical protein
MSALGHPSYTMTGTGGRTIYDYVEQFRLAGPTVTYQFTVGPNGKVKSATLTL